jgi:hypothetical protein
MRDFQDVFSNIIDPVIDMDFAAGRAKAGFAGEGNPMLTCACSTVQANPQAGQI